MVDLSGCSEANGGGAVVTLKCIPIIIYGLINYAFVFAGVVALIFIIISGIRLITSSGDPKQAEEAKKTLTWAIVGLILVLLSRAIIGLVGTIANVNIFGFQF